MKVYFLLFIIACLLLSCNQLYGINIDTSMKKEPVECKIIKIDSIRDYYLIYAQSDTSGYKIISEKDDKNCKNIFIDKQYKLTLSGNFECLNIMFRQDMHFILPDGSTIEVEYEWGQDLFRASEIKGLCYTPLEQDSRD